MASEKYDVCSRLEIEGREKPLWPKVGMVVTIRDDGKVSVFDARTGQNYPAFKREPRPVQASQPPTQTPPQQTDQGFIDDQVPF